MHGAAMTHLVFLPAHAGVVELFEFGNLKHQAQWFVKLAHIFRLKHTYWNNLNPNNDFSEFRTYVPVLIVKEKINYIYKQMC
jgi:hypothetical protein